MQLDFLKIYYFFMIQKEYKKSASAKKTAADLIMEQTVDEAIEMLSEKISAMFLKAVKEHDRDKIIEIADAVWFFKGKIEKIPDEIADKQRDALLVIKRMIRDSGSPMDVHTAVSFVELITGQKVEEKEHSYPAFRKKCKELGVPIQPLKKSSKIRQK